MTTAAEKPWYSYLEEALEQEARLLRDAEEMLKYNKRSGQGAPNEHEVSFGDPFSPSSSKVGIDDPSHLQSQAARALIYGDDWTRIAEAAVEWVIAKGYPVVNVPLLGQYTPVSDDALTVVAASLAEQINQASEHSDEWLCYLIYYRFLDLANLYTSNAPAQLIFDSTFKAGAMVRELELQHLNKKDALARKRAKRALGKSNEGRAEINARRKAQAQAWHKHAEKLLETYKRENTNSAKADFIRANWDRLPNAPTSGAPGKRTIENWLSTKASRTRSSE